MTTGSATLCHAGEPNVALHTCAELNFIQHLYGKFVLRLEIINTRSSGRDQSYVRAMPMHC